MNEHPVSITGACCIVGLSGTACCLVPRLAAAFGLAAAISAVGLIGWLLIVQRIEPLAWSGDPRPAVQRR